ncbi:hypothetical protein Hanom_Chr07g00678231 [Helianthus anomalus]
MLTAKSVMQPTPNLFLPVGPNPMIFQYIPTTFPTRLDSIRPSSIKYEQLDVKLR